MIENIELNCGPTPDSEPVKLPSDSCLTIFVGPNNCGKSALLNAIYDAVAAENMSPESPRASALREVVLTPFEESILQKHPNFQSMEDQEIVHLNGARQSYRKWIKIFENDWKSGASKVFRDHFCLWMSGSKRLQMLPKENNVNLSSPEGPLGKLLVEDQRRAVFQDTVYEGIEHYPVINTGDPYGSLQLAFSKTAPAHELERTLSDAAIDYQKEAIQSHDASDGFNAYVGMLGAIFAKDYKVVLIDEPEAFLHPALARTLGKQISKHSEGKHVYVATHSAEFVMGAVESGLPVSIVRLQYERDTSSACLLDSAKLRSFMQTPLLRSANVLSGLFSRSVFVTESDTDRAFYQEINTRLLSKKDDRGVENAVFLNAQNKQTVPTIVELLREMGVPSVGIVDLDVVSDGGKNWTKQLHAFGVPKTLHEGFSATRSSIFGLLKNVSTDEAKKEFKYKGGINLLENQELNAAKDFLAQMAGYGLMIVPTGEVESWLKDLEIVRSKNSWLHNIFEKMGTDPDSSGYVSPHEGDVWDFIGDCKNWLSNPNRKGMAG